MSPIGHQTARTGAGDGHWERCCRVGHGVSQTPDGDLSVASSERHIRGQDDLDQVISAWILRTLVHKAGMQSGLDDLERASSIWDVLGRIAEAAFSLGYRR